MKRFLLIGLMLLMALEAFPQHPKKALKAYESAEKAFQMRDYAKAHQQVLKAIV